MTVLMKMILPQNEPCMTNRLDDCTKKTQVILTFSLVPAPSLRGGQSGQTGGMSQRAVGRGSLPPHPHALLQPG